MTVGKKNEEVLHTWSLELTRDFRVKVINIFSHSNLIKYTEA